MYTIIALGTINDIDELEKLYDDLNDYLEQGINYPGWRKGIYPTRTNAEHGINNQNLFVARLNNKIIGTIILSHEPEEAYKQVKWGFQTDYSDVIVIHTFAVHPAYIKSGIGKLLMNFAITYAKEQQMKAIRLDVYEKNLPAIKLYESCGFNYIDTVDLGYGSYGLPYFKLYEKII